MAAKRFHPPNAKRRPPDRQDEIVEYFRRRILDGQLRPGERLPDRLTLKEQLGVSYLTVQRAFDRLQACGFVESRQAKGTFVAEHLPHLSRFALAFADPVSRSRFYSALAQAAVALSTPERTVEIYEGVDGKRGSEGDAKLLRDVEHRSVAGLIFPSHPWHLKGSELLAADIPRISIGDTAGHWGLPGPGMDGMAQFLDRAVERLASLGCSRLACLSSAAIDANTILEPWRRKLAARGLVFERKWLQAGGLATPDWNRGLVRLLLDGAPDGLVILDDNIAWEVFDEIAAMGRGVQVVSHCNFPFVGKPPLPAHFLGYDAKELLERCLHPLQSGAVKTALVKAKFQDEL